MQRAVPNARHVATAGGAPAHQSPRTANFRLAEHREAPCHEVSCTQAQRHNLRYAQTPPPTFHARSRNAAVLIFVRVGLPSRTAPRSHGSGSGIRGRTAAISGSRPYAIHTAGFYRESAALRGYPARTFRKTSPRVTLSGIGGSSLRPYCLSSDMEKFSISMQSPSDHLRGYFAR